MAKRLSHVCPESSTSQIFVPHPVDIPIASGDRHLDSFSHTVFNVSRCVAVDFYRFTILTLNGRSNEIGDRMGAKIRRKIAHAQLSLWIQITGIEGTGLAFDEPLKAAMLRSDPCGLRIRVVVQREQVSG
jgi:hypothetical protein